MNARRLEICVDSLEGARVAAAAGADRIELCSALELDGLSPGRELLDVVLDEIAIPVMVMVRPRAGNFVYDACELAGMEQEIREARSTRAHGVVAGALRADRSIDEVALRRLLDAAQGVDFTFHRAFDASADVFASLETLMAAGVPRVLTSGGAANVGVGLAPLGELIRRAGSSTIIMPGGGVSEGNLSQVTALGAREIHSSASVVIDGIRSTSGARVAGLRRILIESR